MTLRRLTEENVVDALRRNGYDVKRQGSEWHSGCPYCGEGKDRLRVHTLNGTLITQCRQCGADGPALWKILGLLKRGEHAETRPIVPIAQQMQPAPTAESHPAGPRLMPLCPGDEELERMERERRERAARDIHAPAEIQALYVLEALLPDGVPEDLKYALAPSMWSSGVPVSCAGLTRMLTDIVESDFWDGLPPHAKQATVNIFTTRGLDKSLSYIIAGRWDARAGGWKEGSAAPAAENDDPVKSGEDWIEETLGPPVVEMTPDAPGLAYAGLMTILHADRGTGKTLFVVWLVTCALRTGLRALLLADDDPFTWARRLKAWSAPLEALSVMRMGDAAKSGALERAAEERDTDLLVVDSWRRWATSCGATGKGAMNDESIVGPIADRLVDVAKSGPAVVLLANEAKGSDGVTMRGSSAPEDAVTGAVRSAERRGEVTIIRTAGKVRDGVPAGPWSMRLTDDGFVAAGVKPEEPFTMRGEPSKHDRLCGLAHEVLFQHPDGLSMSAAEKAIRAAGGGGRNNAIREAVKAVGTCGSAGRWILAPAAERIPMGEAGRGSPRCLAPS